MTSFLKSDRSRPVAIWLFAVAALVLAMVVVGGATRLTGSGLSITEWRPVTGAVPPLSDGAWREAFAKYQQIPQYELINRGMTLAGFKAIYWWEWAHRFLGRLVGAAFAIPFLVFLVRRQIPSRLTWRCWTLLALGGLQGAVGWWMVASGLSERVSVAPERLMLHQGLAFVLFAGLIWTGLEAWFGQARQTLPSPWARGAQAFAVAVFLQLMLGALVAGSDAGLVYNDWPLMGGALFPADYAKGGLWGTLAHSPAAVQLHHRLWAYVLLVWALAMGFQARRSSYLVPLVKALALALTAAVVAQAALGVWTLMAVTPIHLAVAHQAFAAVVFALALTFAWRVRRL